MLNVRRLAAGIVIAAAATAGLGFGTVASANAPSECVGRRIDVEVGVAGAGSVQIAECIRIKEIPDAKGRQRARLGVANCPGVARLVLWTHPSPRGPHTAWITYCSG